jgi:hypothetical protein
MTQNAQTLDLGRNRRASCHARLSASVPPSQPHCLVAVNEAGTGGGIAGIVAPRTLLVQPKIVWVL